MSSSIDSKKPLPIALLLPLLIGLFLVWLTYPSTHIAPLLEVKMQSADSSPISE